MSTAQSNKTPRTAIVVGASRGLGHALVAEFLKRGWNVLGTVLESDRTMLHDLADTSGGRVEIAHLDMCEPGQIANLRKELAGRQFDVLFVSAGIAAGFEDNIRDATRDEFVRIMVTNAFSPMKVIEALEDLISPTGLIGAMSSGQGSLTNNDTGGSEVYRSSKAALNMLMRSYAARHRDSNRALALIAPGWVRTELGGPNAPLGIEDSIPKIVDVLMGELGSPGLKYLDYLGRTVPW